MLFYYFIVSLILLLISPYLIISNKARAGIWQKLGFIPSKFYASNNSKNIRLWFHAVSVGEFNAIYPVITKLHDLYPELEIFISTTTKTGNKIAKDSVGNWAHIFYFPLDLPIFIKPWLNKIKPSLIGIVETEIWPGFLSICQKENIPTMLINGRLSPKSYSSFSFFIGNILHKFQKLLLQSELDAHRFMNLSKNKLPIIVTGNIKFDGMKAITNEAKEAIKRDINISENDLVLVAGSTHEGEESAILSAINLLQTKFNLPFNIRLIIAPRHPERFNRVCQIIESYNFTAKRYSQKDKFADSKDIYVLDTIGKLSQFYSVASLAFVGGTLIKIGGHSIVEPCVYGIPVITGKYLYKTKSVADSLINAGTLFMVSDANDLAMTINKLANSATERELAGKAGKVWLANNQGATDKTIEVILDSIKISKHNFKNRELVS
jgi:3-deoxy-D-manno-octulosonic-acid transferase